jgi:hypothetical protein
MILDHAIDNDIVRKVPKILKTLSMPIPQVEGLNMLNPSPSHHKLLNHMHALYIINYVD